MGIHVAPPIIKNIKDSRDALDFFEMVSLPAEDERTQEIIRSFPTVYIHCLLYTSDAADDRIV